MLRASVIVNALSKVFAGEKKYEAADETGISEKELLEKYIDRGIAGDLLGMHRYAGTGHRAAVAASRYGRMVHMDIE